MRILVVEDDAMLSDAIVRAFTQAAHAVDAVTSGEDADQALCASQYDLVLLDISLPRMDGLEVLRRLRARRAAVPVLIVTVRDSIEDVVAGLDLGADDYLTKPFHLSELEARVRALIRRAHAGTTGATSDIVHGRLRLDSAGRRLFLDETPVDLSARELSLLELLLLKAGKVVTKQQILDNFYGWDEASTSNAIEVVVYRLRKKTEQSGIDIRTIRGMGYLIEKAL